MKRQLNSSGRFWCDWHAQSISVTLDKANNGTALDTLVEMITTSIHSNYGQNSAASSLIIQSSTLRLYMELVFMELVKKVKMLCPLQ